MARMAVVGEALLDVDLEGHATRLSPEAPVPVLDDLTERARPGGAALAAAMCARDGHDVVLLTPLADDEVAERLRALLAPSIEVIALPHDGPTPVKRRVRAGGHNLLRLDEGGRSGPWGSPIAAVDGAFEEVDAVLVSDYGRGLTSDPDCRRALTAAARNAPLVWDPHPRGADPVDDCLLYTPNEAELLQRADVERPARTDRRAVHAVAREAAGLVNALGVRAVAATMGSRGALLSFGEGTPQLFATRQVTGDSCGAGDRFASAVTGSIAEGRLLSGAVQSAVNAATEHVARGGAAAFGRHGDESVVGTDAETLAWQVRGAGGTLVATGGCFDLLHAGHVAMLEAARSLGDRLIVCLNSDASITRLKGEGRPLMPVGDRARVLSSLTCVDAVAVFDEDTPAAVIQRLRPDIWVKGGDYAGQRLPEEEVLEQWGGQAVVVPYLEGRSTSGLVRTMSHTH